MFKRFTLLLCLIVSVLVLPTNLLANEKWQPKRDIISALMILTDEDIKNEFPKLVMKEDRENYALLMAQLLIYRHNEITKGEAFLKIANEELARKGKNNGSISTNTLKMVVAIKNNDNTSIIEYGEKTLSQMKKSDGISHSRLFKIMISLSDAYYTIGEFDNSLKIAKDLLTVLEESSNTQLKADTYFSISESSYKLSQYVNAENAAKKSYKLYLKLNDNKGLGHAKKALGNSYLGRGELKKAQESYTAAITYYKKIKDNHGLANCYFNIGLILKKSNSWEQSIDVFELAYFHYMESGSSGGAGMAKMEIGRSFTKLKKFKTAQFIFKESRGLLTKTNKISRLKQLASYEKDLNKTTHLNTTYNSNKTIKVVSIKGYGIDYSDNSHVCFYEEGPNYVMSDDPARCHTNWMESNATWESEVSIRKNELVMTMNNLRSAHPPLHTLGIGYIVEIEGGTFEDGSTKKKFILHKFTGTPIQSDITKRVKILL
jgi:tetratricopeptide (TPR) repeat protein